MSEQAKRAEGSWPADDIRRAFVAGAKWWEFTSQGATMWPSDTDKAEAEAERRYPGGSAAALEAAERRGVEKGRRSGIKDMADMASLWVVDEPYYEVKAARNKLLAKLPEDCTRLLSEGAESTPVSTADIAREEEGRG